VKFTIVVPSYNQESFLRPTIDSILDQGRPGLEILVNDGGSSDGSLEILCSFGDRIQWSSGRDRGQTDAINKGMLAATGDILAYLNSDDVYLPGALDRVAAYFTAHPSCDLLYGDAWHLHADGSIKEPYPTEPWDYSRLFHHCYLCQPAVFWRRSLMLRHGLFDERLHYAMDYEFWLRIGAKAEVHYLSGHPLAGSRLHVDAKTLKFRLAVHREILQVVRRLARHPGDCYTWLKHLAALEAGERGFAASVIPERHNFHVVAYAAQVLTLAEDHHIPLDHGLFAELTGLIRPAPAS
jgi:glycosyltransferase involved in cell wall biosynthesis